MMGNSCACYHHGTPEAQVPVMRTSGSPHGEPVEEQESVDPSVTQGIPTSPDVERDALSLEVPEPVSPQGLPIFVEASDALDAHYALEAPHHSESLFGGGVPCFRHWRPYDVRGDALVSDGDRQHVDVELAETPIRPVHDNHELVSGG